jgi:AraC family transcriptional regulator
MPKSSAFGDEFGKRLKAKVTGYVRSLRSTHVAVTEILSDENAEYGMPVLN